MTDDDWLGFLWRYQLDPWSTSTERLVKFLRHKREFYFLLYSGALVHPDG